MHKPSYVNQFFETLKYFFDALGFMARHKMMKFFLYPFVFTILLWAGGFVLISNSVDWISETTHQYLQVESSPSGEGFFSSWTETWEVIKSWYNGASTIILSLLLKISFWIILWVLTKYVLLIVLSPVLAYVSEKTESIISGSNYPLDMAQIMKDALRGAFIAIRNLIIEMAILLALFILTFFMPFISPITAVLGFVIGAYFYGYSMIDYIAERKRLNLSSSNRFVRKNAGVALALGALISLGIMVPFIGFLTASFISIISAVAAVMVIHNEAKKSTLGTTKNIQI